MVRARQVRIRRANKALVYYRKSPHGLIFGVSPTSPKEHLEPFSAGRSNPLTQDRTDSILMSATARMRGIYMFLSRKHVMFNHF